VSIIFTSASVFTIFCVVYRFGYWYLYVGIDFKDLPLFDDPTQDLIKAAQARCKRKLK
jgi:hypothetical protein